MSCSRTSQGRWWGPAPSGRSMSGRCSSTTLTRTMDCRAEAWASTTGTSCTWLMPVTTSGGRWGRGNVSGKGWAVKSATPSIWGTIYSPLTAERDEGADHYWLTVSNLNIHARLGNCCQMGRRRGSESFPPSKGGSGKQNAKTELWNGTEEMEGPRLVWTGNVCNDQLD